MAAEVAHQTEELLLEAERQGRFYVPDSKRYRARMQRLVDRGIAVRVLRGMYAHEASWRSLNPVERQRYAIRSLAVQHPTWTFCDVSAAVMHGLEPSYRALGEVHVLTPPSCHTSGHSTRRAHVSAAGDTHRASGRSEMSVCWHRTCGPATVEGEGVRVTALPRVLYDCLARLPFSEGLALADAGTARLGWTARRLVCYCESLRSGRHDTRTERVVTCASFADPRSESGGESIARGNIICLGREIPHLQVWIDDLTGLGRRYRADFLWILEDDAVVVGELDGKAKYRDEAMTRGRESFEVMYDERQRESRISASGIRVMRFGFDDVRKPERFSRILDAYHIPMADDLYEQARQHEELRLSCESTLRLRFDGSHPTLVQG